MSSILKIDQSKCTSEWMNIQEHNNRAVAFHFNSNSNSTVHIPCDLPKIQESLLRNSMIASSWEGEGP